MHDVPENISGKPIRALYVRRTVPARWDVHFRLPWLPGRASVAYSAENVPLRQAVDGARSAVAFYLAGLLPVRVTAKIMGNPGPFADVKITER